MLFTTWWHLQLCLERFVLDLQFGLMRQMVCWSFGVVLPNKRHDFKEISKIESKRQLMKCRNVSEEVRYAVTVIG